MFEVFNVITFLPLYRYTYYKMSGLFIVYGYTVIPQNINTVTANPLVGVGMGKRKTSISVDADLWMEWTMFVIKKTGSSRKLSEELENALEKYMKKSKEDKTTTV